MTDTTETGKTRHAGAFDIRTIIAMLIGLYGGVLVLAGLFGTTEADLERAGGMNINLNAGIGMAVVAALFVVWARLRPVEVPDEVQSEVPAAEQDERTTQPAGRQS